MKKLPPRSVVAIAATLALAVLALTGCAPAGSGGPSSGGAPNPVPAKTYSEQDLVKILTNAGTTLHSNGTVTDIGLMANAPATRTKSLYSRVHAQGGTFTPAECGPLFDKVTTDILTFGNNAGAYSATLTFGTTVVSATSAAKPEGPTDLEKLVVSDIDSMDSKCPSMAFTFAANSPSAPYHLTFQKQDVKTDAGVAHAYNEVTSSSSSTVHTVSGIVIDGNLMIGFAGLSSATTTDDLVKAINAVHAAAR